MKHTTENYNCDKCGANLKTSRNALNIVTTLSDSLFWSRLHVKIKLHSGMHNDGKWEDADLCKKCAIELLSDALKRVRKGERATAGAEEVEQKQWGKD